MSYENPVVWHEGLFLQPHHFQQQDRHFDYLLTQHTKLHNEHLWGYQNLILDTDLLSIGKINIVSAEGIFPDGSYFHIPRNDCLPDALDLRPGLKNTLIYLALPLKNATQKCRRAYETWEVLDVTTDQGEPVPLQISKLRPQLKTDQEDLANFTYLACAKIVEARVNHHITLDPNFLPTYLDVQHAPKFQKFILELSTLLNHRAEMLAGRLTDTQYAGTAEMIDFMLLQLINRYEPLFHYLSSKRQIHPETLFQIFIQLQGELSTFTNDQRRPTQQIRYQHDHLQASFEPLMLALRSALSTVLEQNATSLALEAKERGIWVAELHDKTLLDHCQFILAAYSELPLETLRTEFPIQVKIAPVEHLATLISRALPGVSLQAIAVAPRQIPYHANFCYFSIHTEEELWQQLKRSAGIGLHVSNAFPNLKLELWAIRG